MKLTEKIAYMKGLLDGMELDSSTKEGKAILQMAEVMEEMGVYIDDLQSQVDELTELCDLLDKDLGEVETDLYCDDDDDVEFSDDDDEDDDFDEVQYVVNCPSCDETVSLSERQLEEGSMTCPHCGELLEFDYDNIETEFSADADDDEADDAEPEDEGDAE